MELDNILSGSAPVIKKYMIGASTAAGVPLRIPGAGNPGLIQPTTTSAADMIGVCLDSGTYATAQQTDGSDPAAEVSVIINPDAIWAAKLSGGATEDTALSLQTVTTASTDGLTVTTAAEWSSPTYDEGIVWGYSGANAGIIRKITSVSSTAGTVTVAFPNDIAVGDEFLRANLFPLQNATVRLSTAFTQVDASTAVASNEAELKPIEVRLRDAGSDPDGRTNSYVLLISTDHALAGRPST